MMRVLVTGAAGFIGSTLCESLLQRGYEVRGLDAFTSFYDPGVKRSNLHSAQQHPHFELIVGDLLADGLDEALDGVEAVLHLAGEPGVTTSWGRSFDRYLERNVLATQRLVEAASASRVRRLVYASSSSVYGWGGDGLRGSGEPRPTSPYGVTKLAAETLVGAYSQTRGLLGVSLRFFSVYGPRQRPDMAAHRFVEALLDGRPLEVFGDGRQVRDFTYVEDVVDATIAAVTADLPPGSVLDVASGRPISVTTLIEELREIVDVPDVTLRLRSERPGDVPRTEGRIDATCRHLDWSPHTDLQTGLTRQVMWQAAARTARSPEPAEEARRRAATLRAAVQGGR